MGTAPSSSPPAPAQAGAAQDLPSYKEHQTARHKPIWRSLLIFNLALGAYIFTQARKKDGHSYHRTDGHGHKAARETSRSREVMVDAKIEETEMTSPVIEPVKNQQPVPEEQQRELFKWILDENEK